jgi:hypothetical protein
MKGPNANLLNSLLYNSCASAIAFRQLIPALFKIYIKGFSFGKETKAAP